MVDQLARLAAAYEADTPPRDPGIAASVCGLEVADALASLLLAPAGDWVDRPRPLVGGPTPPPSDVLARIAMHRYLATDWRTLAALMEEADAASWEAADRDALQVLAHVAARRTEGWSRSVDALEAHPSTRDGSPQPFVRGELYASAAWAGALALVGLQELGFSPVVAAWAGMGVVLAARLLAMAFRITLPTYSERQ
jgi:hypothetical protein